MKLLLNTLSIVSLLGCSYFSFATEKPFESQFTLLCGIDEHGKDICLNQSGQIVPVPKSMPKS